MEESILDVILEKSANTERVIQRYDVKKQLETQLKLLAKREKKTRQSTITIVADNEEEADNFITEIESTWQELNGAPIIFWRSKNLLFTEMSDKQSKEQFLRYLNDNKNDHAKLVKNIKAPAENGDNYTRKAARFEIANVQTRIKLKDIQEAIETAISTESAVMEFKDGKSSEGKRNVYFRANANASLDIIWVCDGVIGLKTRADKKNHVRLYPRILARPYICKECFSIGTHQCGGKRCGKCGLNGHSVKDCKSKTKSCVNCNNKGHKAKDAHCPKYIQAVTNEIRKMDIPLDFYEDESPRFVFLKNLAY